MKGGRTVKNNDVFDEIYQKYANRVYRYIFNKCQNKELAEDITQTTFVKAIEHAASFKNDCDILTWLCQIAKNTMLDELSRHEHKNMHLEDIEGSENLFEADNDILAEIISAEEKTALYKNIHLLEEKQKEIILHRMLGLSFKEIGTIFDQSETWARVNYYRAKEKLQKSLDAAD